MASTPPAVITVEVLAQLAAAAPGAFEKLVADLLRHPTLWQPVLEANLAEAIPPLALSDLYRLQAQQSAAAGAIRATLAQMRQASSLARLTDLVRSLNADARSEALGRAFIGRISTTLHDINEVAPNPAAFDTTFDHLHDCAGHNVFAIPTKVSELGLVAAMLGDYFDEHHVAAIVAAIENDLTSPLVELTVTTATEDRGRRVLTAADVATNIPGCVAALLRRHGPGSGQAHCLVEAFETRVRDLAESAGQHIQPKQDELRRFCSSLRDLANVGVMPSPDVLAMPVEVDRQTLDGESGSQVVRETVPLVHSLVFDPRNLSTATRAWGDGELFGSFWAQFAADNAAKALETALAHGHTIASPGEPVPLIQVALCAGSIDVIGLLVSRDLDQDADPDGDGVQRSAVAALCAARAQRALVGEVGQAPAVSPL